MSFLAMKPIMPSDSTRKMMKAPTPKRQAELGNLTLRQTKYRVFHGIRPG